MNKIKYYKNARFTYNLDDFNSDYRLYKKNHKEKLISRIKDFKKILDKEIKKIGGKND